MPVPAAIIAQVSALDSAIAAAGDINAASFDVVNSLAFRAGQLAQAIEDATPAAAGALDTFSAPLMPQDIIAGVLGVSDSADTQTALMDLEGFVARIEINLESR